MKTGTLLFVAAFGLSALCQAQEHHAYKSFFGNEITEWYGQTMDYDWNENHMLRTTADTTFDGKTYKKIIFYDVSLTNGNYYERSNHKYDFYLREDTTTGQLWCRYPDEDEDFLIADMSLSIGDSIMLRNYDNYYDERKYYVIDKAVIDNRAIVLLYDSFYISYPFVDPTFSSVCFIEGVGCSNLISYSRYYRNLFS